jgi:hypothetical protein
VREIKFRKLKSINIDNYLDDMRNELSFCPDSDVTVNVERYNSVLESILDKHAPVVTKNVCVRPKVAWMNDNIRQEKKERRRLERQWRHTRKHEDLLAFKLQRNRLNSIMKNGKKQYYSDVIEQCDGDLKSLFRVCKSLLIYNPETQFPDEKSDLIVANNFSDFFVFKIDNIRKQFEQSNTTTEKSPGITFILPLRNFSLVSPDNISDILKKCSMKSCELDPVPVCLLNGCCKVPEFLKVITEIINQSLSTGVFPDSFKQALISPLLKKSGLDLRYENYRPISNLPFMSKLLERVVSKQLIEHITVNNLDVKYQSAYKAFHSTETALLRVQNDILQSMDRNEVSVLIMLDLSAAFDTVDINILLQRLEDRYNISGTALAWFSSYLNGREQVVSINGHKSKVAHLKCGIPQGSVLGPKLFAIYTSPLCELIESHGMKYHLYADDTQLYLSFKPGNTLDESAAYAKLHECLCSIKEWMFANKLKLNSDKTEYMVIGRHIDISKTNTDYLSFDKGTIVKNDVVKNLGVYFDDSLSMVKHVNHVSKSVSFYLRGISRIREFLSRKSCESLVHALISSRIDYCNSLLYGLPSSVLSKLQLVHNMAARVVTMTGKYEHITPVLADLHWLPIRQRIEYKVILLTFKALNDLAPSYISELIHMFQPINENMRSANKLLLDVPRSRLVTCGDRCFQVAAPTLWNKLPQELRNITNLDIFKSQLKTHLYEQAFSGVVST